MTLYSLRLSLVLLGVAALPSGLALAAASDPVSATLRGRTDLSLREREIGRCSGSLSGGELALTCRHGLSLAGFGRLVRLVPGRSPEELHRFDASAGTFELRWPLGAEEVAALGRGELRLVVDALDASLVEGGIEGELIFGDDFEAGSYCGVWSSVVSQDPCDGVDNDCDADFDEEAACDDALECTADFCGGLDGCQADVNPGFCAIEEMCLADGEPNPNNDCELCDESMSQTGWTNEVDGFGCDDGEACTFTDECLDGSCMGTPYACEDMNACTLDLCDGLGGCTFDPQVGLGCDDGELCTFDDECDGVGGCAGTAYDCDDMEACTVDACDGLGGCTNDPYVCPDDGLACTLDGCDGLGGCDDPVIAVDACVIDGVCYADGDPNGAAVCEVCAPATSQTSWTVAVDSCSIDGVCYADGDPNPLNECEYCKPASSQTDWSNQPGNVPCAGGAGHCGGGTCHL